MYNAENREPNIMLEKRYSDRLSPAVFWGEERNIVSEKENSETANKEKD